MKKVFFIMLALFMVTSCSSERKEPDGNTQWIDVYYANNNGDLIASEQRAITVEDSITARIKDAIEKMMEKPIGKNLTPLLPTGTVLVSAKFDHGVAKIEFSEEFLMLEGMDKTVADYGILMTLLNFWNIQALEITVGDTIVTPRLSQKDIVTEIEKEQRPALFFFIGKTDGFFL